MQALAGRLWPLGFHPGGLGWCLATDQLGHDITLFTDHDELLGFASVEQPGVLVCQADPTRPEIAKAIVDWFLERDGSPVLRVAVADADEALRGAVERAGFRRVDAARPLYWMRRDATPTHPAPPARYAVRAVTPDEYGARVAVHRASWNPHALPWHPEHRPDYPPEARSGHSARMYARVRDAWLYDPALDLVAVAEDGAFVGCCIVWLDRKTGAAEIEPLGVVPDHRRRGVAGSLCTEAIRRVALAGGSALYINQGPNAAYPAPAGAYAKAGFDVVERGRSYELRR
jgi:predicted N-acetyltransferase YhbS